MNEAKLNHHQEITNGFDTEENQILSKETSDDINGGYSILPNDIKNSTND